MEGEIVDTEVKKHPTLVSRRESILQDLRLIGRDFILIPNATYGSWLRAYEGNKIGASDELAQTGVPVREPIKEPTGPFEYGAKEPADANGPKFRPITKDDPKGYFRSWVPDAN